MPVATKLPRNYYATSDPAPDPAQPLVDDGKLDPRKTVTVKMLTSLAGPLVSFKVGDEAQAKEPSAYRMLRAGEASPVCERARAIAALVADGDQAKRAIL